MNFVNLLKVATVFFVTFVSILARSDAPKMGPELHQQLQLFFEDYLSVYNRRFGRPEGSDAFRSEIIELVHFPILQSPPKGAPKSISDPELFAKRFEHFVVSLDKKGVERLKWASVQLHPLSASKVLANNIGHGVNAQGDVIYETVSLYLLYKENDRWRIALFSPYLIDNAIDLK